MDKPMQIGRRQDIGALWVRIDKSHNEYFHGFVIIDGKKIDIVVFHNTKWENGKHPAMVIREDRIRDLLKKYEKRKTK